MTTHTINRRADFGTRFAAIVIDTLILGLLTGLLFSASREAGGIGVVLVGLAYNWYFWTRHDGQTPGKRLMGLRVVKVNGERMSDLDAIARFAGYYLNTAVAMIGWIWALFDDRGQGFHDKLAGTMVVPA